MRDRMTARKALDRATLANMTGSGAYIAGLTVFLIHWAGWLHVFSGMDSRANPTPTPLTDRANAFSAAEMSDSPVHGVVGWFARLEMH